MQTLGDDFDVFVSYARKDNESAAGAKGWVALLVEQLRRQFAADGAPQPLRAFFDQNSIREGRD